MVGVAWERSKYAHTIKAIHDLPTSQKYLTVFSCTPFEDFSGFCFIELVSPLSRLGEPGNDTSQSSLEMG